jgi:hypothetical protein
MTIYRHFAENASTKLEKLHLAIEELGTVQCQNFPDEMYEEEENVEARAMQHIIKQICSDCPIRFLCLDYAITAREQHGIWGGMTTKERNEIIRQRQNEKRRERYNTTKENPQPEA